MARREIIELLKRYIALLNAAGIHVSSAFLFGSYSNDTASDESDIDVMIVSDKYDENDDVAVGVAWKLTRRVNSKIEPFLVGTQKFRDDDISPLISMVKTQGIKVA